MEIPYFFLLFLFLLFLLFYFFLAGLNMYHVVRFGFFDPMAKIVTIFYLLAVVIILLFTSALLIGVDWNETITITIFPKP